MHIGILGEEYRQARDVVTGQSARNPGHHLIGVIATPALAEVVELLGDVEVSLTGNAWCVH